MNVPRIRFGCVHLRCATVPIATVPIATVRIASMFAMRVMFVMLFLAWALPMLRAQDAGQPNNIATGKLLAGAYAKNINPLKLPVWVNGGIAGKQIDRITDPLHARCLVIGDGTTAIAICIADNCVLPPTLVNRAKAIATTLTGIPAERILIASTHTHSAVSAMEAHGSPAQEDYVEILPQWIAEGIAEAQRRMVPAQWGTTSVVCERFIYCRDWMMKPGKAASSPFSGRVGDSVQMNPGFDNPDKLAPTGPVDTLVPVLAIQDEHGNPISVLASFCTHYAGAPNISADYFGVVANRLADALRVDAPEKFVGIMANATSGNANCIDFSKPAVPFTHIDVGNYVADQILSVLPKVTYTRDVTLDCVYSKIELAIRMPSDEDVAKAQKYVDTHLQGRLPATMDENYARETILLKATPPTRSLHLQAIRLNDFVIVANPCEAYNETGLKIRQASPFALTMNIGLANGHAGYLPPPEMYQLGGYTTWRCRTSCLEENAEPKVVDGIVSLMSELQERRAKGKGQTDGKLSSDRPGSKAAPDSPVSASDAIPLFDLEPGYVIDRVANEPQIVDPISMQIDERGRIWVVEMRDYPTLGEIPKSQVVILSDLDDDGFYESAKPFAEGLPMVTGVQPWQNGALVTMQGQLVMLRDTDGDGTADAREIWLSGFAADNPQLRANHPTLAADGWLYIANGLRGGNVKCTVPFAKQSQANVDMTGGDLRLHMVTGAVEVIAGPSQFGVSIDSFGRRYGCSNRQPCFEIVTERNSIGKSPLAGIAPPIFDVSPSETKSQVYPVVKAWTTSNLHAGQFTAACGVLVTDSSVFGANANSEGRLSSVLTCEPTGSLVQRRLIDRQSGIGHIIPDSSRREWLASRDSWFRPVDLYEGPNSAIYVVDMYRAVIEHPDWVPAELKNRPDQRFGDAHGRIYRVTKSAGEQNGKGRHKSANATSIDESSLLQWIGNPNAWNRRVGVRRFFELASELPPNKFEKVIGELSMLCIDDSSKYPPEAKATACMLLGAVGKLSSREIDVLLASLNSDLRSVVWRVIREQSTANDTVDAGMLESKAIEVVGSLSANAEEKRQAAWMLADVRPASKPRTDSSALDTKRLAAIASMIDRHRDDPHVLLAATAAASDRLRELLSQLLLINGVSADAVTPDSEASVESFARLGLRVAQQEFGRGEFVALLEQIDSALRDESSLRLRRDGLAILDGIARAGKLNLSVQPRLEQSLLHAANEGEDPISQRLAVGILGYSSSETAQQMAMRLLGSSDVLIKKAAMKACSMHDRHEFNSWLLDEFSISTPDIRSAAFSAIRSSPKRLVLLVHRLESGELTARSFDASQVQSLKSVEDKAIGERLRTLLGGSVQQNRQSVVDRYAAEIVKLDIPNGFERGKQVFAKNCSACHRVNDVGNSVGPDISDSREQTLDKLLIAVLDPNRAIDANYFRYVLRTDDGVVVDGVLVEANAQTVTLKNQNGLTTVDRSSISELKSSGVSLMPEGIEAQIPVDEMACLLWYIKNWRYVNESVPANASFKR